MRAFLPAILALALCIAGCDAVDNQRTFRERAVLPPSGYTETDADGNVVAADPDDWRVSPLYGPAASTWVTVDPLRPNPVPRGGTATLLLNVRTGAIVGGVRVVGLVERPGLGPATHQLTLPQDARGFVVIEFVPAAFPAFSQGGGLRRVVVFDGQGEPVTYGDVLLE